MSRVATSPGRPLQRPATRGAGRPGREPGLIRLAGAAAFTHRRSLLLALVVGGGFGVVAWNALLSQTGRHPAPMFGPKPAEIVRRTEAAAPPLPVARPKPAVAAPAADTPTRTGSTSADSIGDLIRAADAPAAKPEPVRAVAAAQRALSKLGYGTLKPDGMLGQGTRAALERFERDRSLPVTGALGPRTAKALGSQSGIAIE
jgi:hypothetical protein